MFLTDWRHKPLKNTIDLFFFNDLSFCLSVSYNVQFLLFLTVHDFSLTIHSQKHLSHQR